MTPDIATEYCALVHIKTIEVDLALITYYDALLRELELSILTTAKQHDAHTLYLLGAFGDSDVPQVTLL